MTDNLTKYTTITLAASVGITTAYLVPLDGGLARVAAVLLLASVAGAVTGAAVVAGVWAARRIGATR